MGNENSGEADIGGVIFNQTQLTIYYSVHSKDMQPFSQIIETNEGISIKAIFDPLKGEVTSELQASIEQKQKTKKKLFQNIGFYQIKSKRISTRGLKFNQKNFKQLSIITEKGQKLQMSGNVDGVQQMRLIIDKDLNIKKIGIQDAKKLIKIGQSITVPSGQKKICVICNNGQEAVKRQNQQLSCYQCQGVNKRNYVCRSYQMNHAVCVHCYNSFQNMQNMANYADENKLVDKMKNDSNILK